MKGSAWHRPYVNPVAVPSSAQCPALCGQGHHPPLCDPSLQCNALLLLKMHWRHRGIRPGGVRVVSKGLCPPINDKRSGLGGPHSACFCIQFLPTGSLPAHRAPGAASRASRRSSCLSCASTCEEQSASPHSSFRRPWASPSWPYRPDSPDPVHGPDASINCIPYRNVRVLRTRRSDSYVWLCAVTFC